MNNANGEGGWRWEIIRQRTGFILSLLAEALSGLAMAFNVYALKLKSTFGFSQTEVEIVSSVGSIGFALACVEFVIYRKFGYKACYVTVLVTSPLACCLFYVAATYSDAFNGQSAVIGMFQMLANCGNNILQTLLAQISVQNCDKRHVGVIVGLYSGLLGSGKILHAAIFELFFADNFPGFWLAIGLSWIGIYSLCFVLHRPIPKEEEKSPILGHDSGCSGNDTHDSGVTIGEGYSFKETMTSPYSQLLFWLALTFYGCFMTFMNNLTSIAQSAGLSDPIEPVYLLSATQVFSHVALGHVYDRLKSEVGGFIVVLICYVLFAGGSLVGMFCFNSAGVFTMTLMVGLSSPARSSLPISMICSRFGRNHYDIIVSAFKICFFAVLLVLQMIVGYLYDVATRKNTAGGSTFCHGLGCFYWTFVIFLVITALMTSAQLINCILYSSRQKK